MQSPHQTPNGNTQARPLGAVVMDTGPYPPDKAIIRDKKKKQKRIKGEPIPPGRRVQSRTPQRKLEKKNRFFEINERFQKGKKTKNNTTRGTLLKKCCSSGHVSKVCPQNIVKNSKDNRRGENSTGVWLKKERKRWKRTGSRDTEKFVS